MSHLPLPGIGAAGTVCHGTRVPLLGIFFLSRRKKGIWALQFQRDTGVVSYQTAWTLLHKLRSGLAARPTKRLKSAVEADETYIGGYRPGRNGRGVGKTAVAIAVERREKTAGAARIAVIPRATTAVLTAFFGDAIEPQETTVFTDAWGSYAALGRLGIHHRPRKGGHGHQAVHLLSWAHTVFGNRKSWLTGTFHGVSPKHLQRYLDEFVFRIARRWRETELFIAVLHRALDGEPCPYGQLKAERIG